MVSTNREEYLIELQDLIKLFGLKEDEINVYHNESQIGNRIKNDFVIEYQNQKTEKSYEYIIDMTLNVLRNKSYRKRMVKNHLYLILTGVTNKTLVWGSLTGVRPTKFARDLIMNNEVREHLIEECLEREYYVQKSRAKLVNMILKNQKCIIRNDNLIDLYVNIPICPTRCLYCSFISSEESRVKDQIESYVYNLLKEIDAVKDIIKKKAYIVRTIYIGGGTPSVLNASLLDKLLSALNFPVSEFTVECGRADTITREKLSVLKKHRVTRLSINPQTFCEATLKRIGRKQKNSEVLSAYSLALEFGFNVNMDIIAGLPGEKLGIFKRTVNTLLELYPDNITVHTLSVKNGALLKNDVSSLSERDIVKMIDYAQSKLIENGYKPYYLYRQKNQLGGLENVGYFRDDKVCIFNIDSMEETNTVIGIGADAISKRVFNIENRIERLPNVKFIGDYISRIDEMIEKKKKFFE